MLIVVAVRFWSPVVVLGAAVLSLGGAALFTLITAAGETCGGSYLAGTVEWVGGAALAAAIGAWGVRRGFWGYGAVLAGWTVAALWFVVVAHLIPGGTGGCFE